MKQPVAKNRINKNIILVGFTSFFTDISSEMIYPLIQAFVSLVLSSTSVMIAPVLGIMEGIAEASASLLKVYSGHIADKFHKRKPLTIIGYSFSGISKALLLLAVFGWGFVLISRFTDRIGKGIRTAPRDALIAESVDHSIQGKAFGFHRAMDYLGAVIGVAVCYFISLAFMDEKTGTITDFSGFSILFLISLVPALMGVVLLFFVTEPQRAGRPILKNPSTITFSGLDQRLKIFFSAVFIFTLGNSSNQFLLLKSMNSGFSLSEVLLMYMAFNFSTAIVSTPLGALSDKIGRKKVILSGYALYSFIYIMFGFVSTETKNYLWLFWILYGFYYALTEGIEKALVAEIAPSEKKATMMGLFSMIVGIGLLPASVLAGLLYSFAGPAWPFLFGGGMSAVAFMIIALFLKEQRRRDT